MELRNKFWLVSWDQKQTLLIEDPETSDLWSDTCLTILEVLHQLSIKRLIEEIGLTMFEKSIDYLVIHISIVIACFNRASNLTQDVFMSHQVCKVETNKHLPSRACIKVLQVTSRTIFTTFYIMHVKFFMHENFTAASELVQKFFRATCKIWMQQTNLNFYRSFHVAWEKFQPQF